MTDAALSSARPTEPLRRRLIRSLLYGRKDRAAKARARVGFMMIAFAAIYTVIAMRLVVFAMVGEGHGLRRGGSQDAVATARPDIVDRNGSILATDVKAPSLYAEPRRIIDKDEAVELLTATLPDLDTAEARQRIMTRKGFVWLKREITPQQQQDIHRLGIPGIGFLRENKRVYPSGQEVAHLIGLVNIDNQGIAGIEKWLDTNGLADLHRAGFATDRQQQPVELAVDLRVEHALRDELMKAKDKFHAKAASGLVSNVRTGEIVAMVSLPDFDPNNPKEANDPDRINRLTTGVYEMGSTFKAFTLAMALDSGKISLNSMWDARGNLHYGKFTIHDSHPLGRAINTKEVFTYSSNIGAARIALSQGVEAHKAFLTKMGQLQRLRTELPESAAPLVPRRWGELNTVTIAFGQGLSVAPLQAVMGINALVNGGYLIPPTFLKRSEEEAAALAKRVVKTETSDKMRFLMRLNAEIGTAKSADVKGYYVGGKTGTSEKVINGRYAKKRVLNSFTAIMPADNPHYQILIMLDEPQALPETHGFITSGWNTVPTGGKVIARIAPLLGMEPRFDLPPAERLILAASKESR
ncbi:penicillin-binding protein 2 [Bradyrhizobium sp. U87765 SZCCT0131]|uniref:peptidoglycan D,D-transpeptidase FtsI family protein n=1 Tax=unclassified Bradyrhizobium TaxID=2631580 RepID=UPI001BA5B7F7|nr:MULTISPECIES: penicillin-binding protein 2 [unclassified Bradyrhizobium]MBR1218393.1 penicillin-binding protein 2 [Bradyrhizobium sp. U87765 SZCCT0131]MBR1260661.1 penicillin-binding protein 2 [Bradyrhizobium sp. U87765 SZCCT0134]MBR1303891.1 penicillin-binding protein 2 [Bradyrhizobium sp. U87765 SZCCT0110]MBR1319497.1 penicillin-binding protein 2 [Bradyrhizobium sp. U87765 SZCCT0109]MBR1347822.1 penicillin-binding protein 2 [Bradyrhizobium sp. U87765 SZCCT0048]